jgi:hypothetical protein
MFLTKHKMKIRIACMFRIIRSLPCGAVLALLVVLVGGCGGSSSSGSGYSLTKTEYLRQGNEFCAEVATQQLQAVESFDGRGAGAGEMEEVVEAVLGPIKDVTDELSSLEGPAAQTKSVKVYVVKLEAAIAKAETNPAAAVNGSVFKSANAAAERAGLRACVL